MYLVKLKDGRYIPYDDTDHEISKNKAVGSVVKATSPRNYEFHKKGMALLNLGFQNQDWTTLFEVYRKEITVQAGYYDEGLNGKQHAKSLSYEAMPAETFDKWYADTLQVIAQQLDTAPDAIMAELAGFA